MTNDRLDLVIAGLGSQPLAYACFVLARMAQNRGLEVHILEPEKTACKALAHVRIGKKAQRAPIGEGEADLLVGLEPVDAIRALGYLKKDGVAILNAPESLCNEQLSKALPDVEDPMARLNSFRTERKDALSMARQMGSPIALVTILLGMLSRHMSFSQFDWRHAIGSSVPRKTFALNIHAFEAGRGEAEAEAAPQTRSLMDESDMTKKDDECSDTTM